MKILRYSLYLLVCLAVLPLQAQNWRADITPNQTMHVEECTAPVSQSGDGNDYCPHSREAKFGCWCQDVKCYPNGKCVRGKLKRCGPVEWHEVAYSEPVAVAEVSCSAGQTVFNDWQDQLDDRLSDVPAEALENQACIDNSATYREARVWSALEQQTRQDMATARGIPEELMAELYQCGYGGKYGRDIMDLHGAKGGENDLPDGLKGLLLASEQTDLREVWRGLGGQASATMPDGAVDLLQSLLGEGYITSELKQSLEEDNRFLDVECTPGDGRAECIKAWGQPGPSGWVSGVNSTVNQALIGARGYQAAVAKDVAVRHLPEPDPTDFGELIEKINDEALGPHNHPVLALVPATVAIRPELVQKATQEVATFVPGGLVNPFPHHNEEQKFNLDFPRLYGGSANEHRGSKCYELGAGTDGDDAADWYNYKDETRTDGVFGSVLEEALRDLLNVGGSGDEAADYAAPAMVMTLWKDTSCCLYKCPDDKVKISLDGSIKFTFVVYPEPPNRSNKLFSLKNPGGILSKKQWHIDRYY